LFVFCLARGVVVVLSVYLLSVPSLRAAPQRRRRHRVLIPDGERLGLVWCAVCVCVCGQSSVGLKALTSHLLALLTLSPLHVT
jgi:hypothetical protein